MQNPFRTEESAFRFVWLTIGSAALVVLGSLVDVWVGLGVFVAESLALVGWSFLSGEHEAPSRRRPPPHPPGKRRVLVVANETVGGGELLAEVLYRAGSKAEVLVVCPALNSPIRHWMSDEDGARNAASERLEASLQAMRAAGLDARGEIGDSNPMQAIEDAMRTFAPDELVISTHPAGRSNWLERDLVSNARERFSAPVTHVIVDVEAQARADRDPVGARVG